MAGHNILHGTHSLPFTCSNNGYMTDVSAGYPHHEGEQHRGNAIHGAVYEEEGENSLWLEHVVRDDNPRDRTLWLMWYTPDGRPTIPGGALIHKDWKIILRISWGLIKVKLFGR